MKRSHMFFYILETLVTHFWGEFKRKLKILLNCYHQSQLEPDMAKSKIASLFAPVLGAVLGGFGAIATGMDAGPYAQQGGSAIGALLGMLFNNIALKASPGSADASNLSHPENKQRGFFTPLFSLFLLCVGIAGLTVALYLGEGSGGRESVLLCGGLLLLAVASYAATIARNSHIEPCDDVGHALKRANAEVRRGARYAGAR